MPDIVTKMVAPGWATALIEGVEKISSDFRRDAFFKSCELMKSGEYGPEVTTWDFENMIKEDPSFYSNMANALRNTGNIITTSCIAFHLGDIKVERNLVPDEYDHFIIRYLGASLDIELKKLHEFNEMHRYGTMQSNNSFNARGVTGHKNGAFAGQMERILDEMVRMRVLNGSRPIPNNETSYTVTTSYIRLKKYISQAIRATKPIFKRGN